MIRVVRLFWPLPGANEKSKTTKRGKTFEWEMQRDECTTVVNSYAISKGEREKWWWWW
jgi:hypothetical protein